MGENSTGIFTPEYTEMHREKHEGTYLSLYSVSSILLCALGGKGCVLTSRLALN